MTESTTAWQRLGLALALLAAAASAPAQGRATPRSGDYIVAVVNQELVTAVEVERRLVQVQELASRNGQTLPPPEALRREIVDALIDERVVITYARDAGLRIDEVEIDRAVQNVAAQNQLTLTELRERLKTDGVDFGRFRANLRDQMQIERVREREVIGRIRVSEDEVDAAIVAGRRTADADPELNVAQILVTVPEGADEAMVAERQARAQRALARVRAGEAFDAVAREVSEDGNRERGGEIGLRAASRLPDIFVGAVRKLAVGEVDKDLLRSGAGFHVLKLLARQDNDGATVTETRARHILLRTSPQLTAEVAARQLGEYRRQIESGARRFDDLAREFSEDGSAAQGGDLGWQPPGTMVPEFEQAMNALPLGGISAPLATRFGMHLIQVQERRDTALDPRRLREQVRNQLREQKFDGAYALWTKDLRARAYIEMREPPT